MASTQPPAATLGVADKPQQRQLLVIGVGFPRTGTMSTKFALEMLYPGTRCHHMMEARRNNELGTWAKLATPGEWAGKDELLADILAPYSCCIDEPSMQHWRRLRAMYPDAKILMTVRDSFEVWHQSVLDTVYQFYKLSGQLLRPWLKPFLRQSADLNKAVGLSFFGPQGLFKGRMEDKEFARKVYDEYIADVKASVPADQLLVFNVKEGWEPLCNFLGVPVPDQPFPRVNETASFKQIIENQMKADSAVARRVHTGMAAVAVAGLGAAAMAVVRARAAA